MNKRDSLRNAIYLCLQKSSLPGFLVLMFLPDMSPRDPTQAHLLSKVERKIQSPLDLCNVPLKTFQFLDFFLSRQRIHFAL